MYIHNHIVKQIDTEEDLACLFLDLGGQKVTDHSFFNDDRWIFDDKVQDRNTLNFHKIKNIHMRRAVKEAVFCEMLFPASSKNKKPSTLSILCVNIRVFVAYLCSESIYRFEDVTKYDFDKYVKNRVRYCNENGLYRDGLSSRLFGIELLYFHGARITDSLQFDPFSGCGVWEYCAQLLPKRKNKKATAELPAQVAKGIFDQCIYYLDQSFQILTHSENYLSFFLDELHKYQKGEIKALRRESAVRHYKRWIEVEKISVPKYKPQRQLGLLHLSCLILIQLFTGMRRSELLALPRGGLAKVENNTKLPLYSIEGFLFKTNYTPKPVKWYCPEIVAKAYRVVEKIAELLCPESERLVVISKDLRIFSKMMGNDRICASSYNNGLKYFVKKHRIIDESGELWPIKSHQFRKTYARIMTDYGCDIGLLRLQLKHKTIDMTAEYGDPDLMRLVNEVKSGLQTTNIELLLNNPQAVAGHGRIKIDEWAKTFNGLSSERKKKDFIRGLAATLTIQSNGIGVCVTDPSRETKCNGAAFGSCDPTCQHLVVPMHTHKRIYDDAISQIKYLLNHRVQNELQRVQLQADLKHYEDVAKEWGK
ncbi:site-specific integrase [Maridesulfovibrio frigidus]|uniref:tyrosine-type recombinase/integrase n=1 Tax=Maridesulfovibrio frigidus TaxID=340956 RepID=UPI0004E0C0AA|nr:tyrosine-type recombinase/integrase [Maridesulfovibrio frigidus]